MQMRTAAELSKDKGNTAFKAQNYALALAHYTTSIELDPSCHLYPLNRALVHLKLGQFAEAEKDATRSIELEPVNGVTKALFRRASARKGLAKFALAKQDLLQAKKFGAGPEVDAELASIEKEIQSSQGSTSNDATLPLRRDVAMSELRYTTPATPASSTTAPSIARLRATLKEPEPTSQPSTPSTTTTIPRSTSDAPPRTTSKSTASTHGNELMTPVSTRKLNETIAGSTNSFAEKKKERSTRLSSNPIASASTKASLIEVADAPASGRSIPNAQAPATKKSEFITDAARSPSPIKVVQTSLATAVPSSATSTARISSASFEQTLSSRTFSSQEKLAYLRSIPIQSLSTLLKNGALNPDLLSSILEALSLEVGERLEKYDDTWLLFFLEELSKVDRFELNLGFLSSDEKKLLEGVFERAENGLKRCRLRWGV